MTELARPAYHYAPRANWLSDPNGLVHHQDEWHLFYQYNPFGEEWGHMSWGHAVSRDLAQWEELPPALLEDDRHAIFSGSAVIDHADSAGLGAGAMVALYTGAVMQGPAHQSQCLAWSCDSGRTWEKFADNPVIDRGLADFRDPNVFWHEATGRWIMVVVLSNEQKALIYGSADLKAWQELSTIAGDGAPGTIWECPLLIELPVEGEDGSRWLFKVDVLHGAPGSGAIYQTGVFDGWRFDPDLAAGEPAWQLADHGRDFYAAIAWHEPRDTAGRPVWIGWMGNHSYQAQLPRQGWRGAMSMPRRISLVREGECLRLRQEPELAVTAAVPVAEFRSGRVPASCRIDLPVAEDFGLCLADSQGRSIQIRRNGQSLHIARIDPVTPGLDVVDSVLLAIGGESALWCDAGSVELVGADGLVCCTLQHRMQGPDWLLSCEQGPLSDHVRPIDA